MINPTPAQKNKLCQACPHRRNYYCTKHGDEIRRLVKSLPVCEGWGNVPPPITEAVPLPGETIRLGICIPNCSMGGVTRGILSMMNAPVNHGIEWAGIAIGNNVAFHAPTARKILKHCPIFSTVDRPEYGGLVTIVPNACQTMIDRSDVVKLWGYICSNPEIEAADWDRRPLLLVAHGQCEWTRKSLALSLSKGTRHILVSVSAAGVKCFPASTQDRVTVIYNGVDFTRCAPARDRDEIRRDWGLDPETRAIGYVGRFANDKNPLAAARAVAELGDGYHAIYVGDGIRADSVIPAARELCGDQLTVVPPVDDVGSIYAALDCTVMASPAEGGPQTTVEAWVAGCPVVSTPVGFIPELEAAHGPLVFPVPVDPTASELAASVRAALSGEGRTERARKLAWGRFSAARMVLGYESAIRATLQPERLETPAPAGGMLNRLKRFLKCWSTAN